MEFFVDHKSNIVYKWVEGLDNLAEEFSDQSFLVTDEILETPSQFLHYKIFEELWERGFIRNVEGNPKDGVRFLVKEKTQEL